MHVTAVHLIDRMERSLGWAGLGSRCAYADMHRYDWHVVSSGEDLPSTWVC